MRTTESVKFLANQTATSVTKELRGGKYGIDILATGAGTVDFQRLGPDGVTFIKAITQVVATPVAAIVADLPPGQYQAVTTGFTAVYLTASTVP